MKTLLITEKADNFDKINDYYSNGAKLSKKEHEIAERWELAFALLLEHRNRKAAIGKLIRVISQKGKKLSIPQAYRDMNDAERLFAPIKQYKKDFLRLVLLESAFRDVKEADKRAKEAKTVTEWMKCKEIKNKAEYRIIQVSGLNESHIDIPDFSKLQQGQFNLTIKDEDLSLFKSVISHGRIDVTELMTNIQKVEDAEEID